jgi:hypothetical protein
VDKRLRGDFLFNYTVGGMKFNKDIVLSGQLSDTFQILGDERYMKHIV